ncbi:hypothetical protein DPM13_07850 [Paracoccus mutanolyticus]|uniref:Uncharacterized protein n=1 Tax=Paracoccus mutanolyticus TaxID=1499308 RepID=A0ABM6WR60_9RHOB|nr:hypothetical protein DPM13_07850 [Paracoccus mutanolyticus]
MASLWLVRDFDNGFRLGGGVRYVGERYGDDANNYPLDSNNSGRRQESCRAGQKWIS